MKIMLISRCGVRPSVVLILMGLLVLLHLPLVDSRYCTNEGECYATEESMMDALVKGELDDGNDDEDEDYGYDDDEDEEYHDGQGVDEEEEDYDDSHCRDEERECGEWAARSECKNNPGYMLENCPVSCGQCVGGHEQTMDNDMQEEMSVLLEKVHEYLRTAEDTDRVTHRMLPTCKAKHPECLYWAVLGECEENPFFMKRECAAFCFACDYASVERRCPWNATTHPDCWVHGDLEKFFVNVTTLPEFQKYHPTILSSPNVPAPRLLEDQQSNNSNDSTAPRSSPLSPWVVTLDDFLTHEECDRMIELGFLEGYERSSDVGEMKTDGTFSDFVNEGRTSTNAWCSEKCKEDPLARAVIDRISNLTAIPEGNSEDLQILRYEIGQHYQEHHDFIEYQIDRQSGPRILTIFLYLNDVAEGGGTNFPALGLTVQPKKGKALIWPSVYDNNFDISDELTNHQALPVIKGEKYGANAWIHLRDFKAANENGCD